MMYFGAKQLLIFQKGVGLFLKWDWVTLLSSPRALIYVVCLLVVDCSILLEIRVLFFILFFCCCFALNWSYRRKTLSLWPVCRNLRPRHTTRGWLWKGDPLGEEPVEIMTGLFTYLQLQSNLPQNFFLRRGYIYLQYLSQFQCFTIINKDDC